MASLEKKLGDATNASWLVKKKKKKGTRARWDSNFSQKKGKRIFDSLKVWGRLDFT